jgi:hypothetical protein
VKNKIADSLALAFKSHDIECISHGDYFEVDNGKMWIRPDVYIKHEESETSSVVLELVITSQLLGNRQIQEAFAGIGTTVDLAANQAFGKFLLGSFHVLIEALTSHQCDTGQAEIEEWNGTNENWRVFSGPLISQHSSGSLLDQDYRVFFPQLQVIFEAEVQPGPHWIRVFIGVFDGKISGGEVLLDNEKWESGERLLFEFPWNCSQEYQSLRHFLVAIPNTKEPISSDPKENSKPHNTKPWWSFW